MTGDDGRLSASDPRRSRWPGGSTRPCVGSAVDNVCRHVGNPIDDGLVEAGCLTCPWHGWRYDLGTGEHLTLFGRRPGLRTYPVRTEGDDVLIDVD